MNIFSLLSPPSWNPERDSKGWELSSVVSLNHPKVIHAFPQVLLNCARDVEIMIISIKQNLYHLHNNLDMTKVLFAVL